MTRVIHTGDTHLGYRQYHSPERRADFLAAFRRVVEDAIEGDVDAVVHAGDLFHDRSPSLLDVHGAIEVLRDLTDADIPFLAVVGNHERTREGQWVDLFSTLGLATRLGDEPRTVGEGAERVAFYGLDYVPPSRRDELDYGFAPHDADHAALVAHGPFDPFVPEVRTDRWDLEAVLEASTVDFDAALLGDDHTPDTVELDGTWATYCGSTERVDASERAERGYNIVEFDGDVRISRRGLETRRFVMVDLELAAGEGISRVRERLREEDVEDAVVVVRVEGDGEPVPPAEVETFAAERGALIARVSDRRDVESTEAVPEVSFADPDEAVRERLRTLGLSEAATAIDATIRDVDVADANVRDRVREEVESIVEEDPGALEPGKPEMPEAGEAATHDVRPGEEGEAAAPGGDGLDESASASSEDRGAAEADDEDGGASGEPDAPAGDEEPEAAEASDEAADDESVEGDATEPEERPAEAEEPTEARTAATDGAAGTAEPDDEDREADAGATTIEDFL